MDILSIDKHSCHKHDNEVTYDRYILLVIKSSSIGKFYDILLYGPHLFKSISNALNLLHMYIISWKFYSRIKISVINMRVQPLKVGHITSI